jgi:hypothetical protein
MEADLITQRFLFERVRANGPEIGLVDNENSGRSAGVTPHHGATYPQHLQSPALRNTQVGAANQQGPGAGRAHRFEHQGEGGGS